MPLPLIFRFLKPRRFCDDDSRMPEPSPSIDRLLELLRAGDESARRELFSRTYDELKILARKQLARLDAGTTIRPTELLHEAWVKLAAPADAGREGYSSQFHFCCTAAKAMRSILVDHARRSAAEKRGHGRRALSLDQTGAVASVDLPAKESIELLPLNDALEQLAAADPELAELVDLRYFAGLGNEEIARLRGLSLATIERRFAVARSFLHRLLKGTDAEHAS